MSLSVKPVGQVPPGHKWHYGIRDTHPKHGMRDTHPRHGIEHDH